ncbi:hypothetical protein GOV11_01975 [Candidatus Woesearchaeota archaeon]|nr:hypothetical protein [Candidatus Woesearchaeota archaeon]
MNKLFKGMLAVLFAFVLLLPFMAQDAEAYYQHYRTPYGSYDSQYYRASPYVGQSHYSYTNNYRYSYGWSGWGYNQVRYRYNQVPSYNRYYGNSYYGGYSGGYLYRTYPQRWSGGGYYNPWW